MSASREFPAEPGPGRTVTVEMVTQRAVGDRQGHGHTFSTTRGTRTGDRQENGGGPTRRDVIVRYPAFVLCDF